MLYYITLVKLLPITKKTDNLQRFLALLRINKCLKHKYEK